MLHHLCSLLFLLSGCWIVSVEAKVTHCMHCKNCDSRAMPNVCLDCHDGYYLSSEKGCRACVPGCASCDGPEKCTTCRPEHFLKDNGSCHKCSPNCAQCMDDLSCSKCEPSRFWDPDQHVCQVCPLANVANCVDVDCTVMERPFCRNCDTGFYNVAGLCEACEPIAHCRNVTCTEDTQECLSCSAGYFLKDGDCTECGVRNCGPQHYYVASECKLSNSGCRPCDASNCHVGQYYQASSCQQQVNGCHDCIACDTNGSFFLTIGDCHGEQSGCHPCSALDAHCVTCPGGMCTGCADGWSYNTTDFECQDVNECANANGGCQDQCTNTAGSSRCSCPIGFELATNELNCTDINECSQEPHPCGVGTCTNSPGHFSCTCPLGHNPKDGCREFNLCETEQPCGEVEASCVKLPGLPLMCNCTAPGAYPNPAPNAKPPCLPCEHGCAQCTTKNNCTSCEEGYHSKTHDDETKCHDNDECVDPHAQRDCLNGECQNVPGWYECKCHNGYVQSYRHARGELRPHCVACDDTNCKRCENTEDESKVDQICLECMDGFKFNAKRTACIPCLEHCAYCNGTGEPDSFAEGNTGKYNWACVSCITHWVLNGTKCSECPVRCAKCNTNGLCLQCDDKRNPDPTTGACYVNQCLVNNGGCAHEQTCKAVGDGPMCSCPECSKDQMCDMKTKQCIPKPNTTAPVNDGCTSMCGVHATCSTDDHITYKCKCDEGYSGTGIDTKSTSTEPNTSSVTPGCIRIPCAPSLALPLSVDDAAQTITVTVTAKQANCYLVEPQLRQEKAVLRWEAHAPGQALAVFTQFWEQIYSADNTTQFELPLHLPKQQQNGNMELHPFLLAQWTHTLQAFSVAAGGFATAYSAPATLTFNHTYLKAVREPAVQFTVKCHDDACADVKPDEDAVHIAQAIGAAGMSSQISVRTEASAEKHYYIVIGGGVVPPVELAFRFLVAFTQKKGDLWYTCTAFQEKCAAIAAPEDLHTALLKDHANLFDAITNIEVGVVCGEFQMKTTTCPPTEVNVFASPWLLAVLVFLVVGLVGYQCFKGGALRGLPGSQPHHSSSDFDFDDAPVMPNASPQAGGFKSSGEAEEDGGDGGDDTLGALGVMGSRRGGGKKAKSAVQLSSIRTSGGGGDDEEEAEGSVDETAPRSALALLEEVMGGLGIPKYGYAKYLSVLTDHRISTVQQLRGLDRHDWERLAFPAVIQDALQNALRNSASDLTPTTKQQQRVGGLNLKTFQGRKGAEPRGVLKSPASGGSGRKAGASASSSRLSDKDKKKKRVVIQAKDSETGEEEEEGGAADDEEGAEEDALAHHSAAGGTRKAQSQSLLAATASPLDDADSPDADDEFSNLRAPKKSPASVSSSSSSLTKTKPKPKRPIPKLRPAAIDESLVNLTGSPDEDDDQEGTEPASKAKPSKSAATHKKGVKAAAAASDSDKEEGHTSDWPELSFDMSASGKNPINDSDILAMSFSGEDASVVSKKSKAAKSSSSSKAKKAAIAADGADDTAVDIPAAGGEASMSNKDLDLLELLTSEKPSGGARGKASKKSKPSAKAKSKKLSDDGWNLSLDDEQ